MKKVILLISLISITFANAQSSWKKIDSKNYSLRSEISNTKTLPKKYNLYNLNIVRFKLELPKTKEQKTTIQLPNIKGETSKFYIEEVSNFTNALSKKYSHIKSFNIKGIDDETATGKISIGSNGVHVTIYSGKHSTLYIDPYSKNKTTLIAYERKFINTKNEAFKCHVNESEKVKKSISRIQKRGANDSRFRTYRLALGCTAEYAQFHLNQQGIPSSASNATKKSAVLSAMNTTITRVNGVYERDLAIKLNIVIDPKGENPLIFLDTKDNLTNDNAGTLLEESQKACDSIVGNSNYDIGHFFSTGAGGLAQIGSVCQKDSKAKGVTGTRNPVGDVYDIDFVSHELGHQLGAAHTFNGDTENCKGNRSDSSAVEPGSGSTIMGYAGICRPQNVQANSNDYFHAVSIESIWNTIRNNSCASLTNTNNKAPVAIAGKDVNVPKSTPLVLRGSATDVDTSGGLTYCWEQIDNEIVTQPPLSTSKAGPTFRSFPPTESPNRYLPKLSTVIAGETSSTWEVLPSVARVMNFSLLVRDNHSGGGAIGRDDMKVTVTNIEPFIVTSQNSPVAWNIDSTQTITWDKSKTDLAPVNCSNVRIRLSTDGGITFPIILAESTPNDGSHEIKVPNTPTSKARIMVEAIDNIFYNVNTSNFTIVSNGPTFLLTNKTAPKSVCNNSSNTNLTYSISVNFLNKFNEPISLSAKNLPKGATVNFSPSTITSSNENITMNISGLSNINPQEYTITISGVSKSISRTTEAKLLIYGTNFPQVRLVNPKNGSSKNSTIPTLAWMNDYNATSYDVQIASDSNFSNIITQTNVTTNTFTLTSPLNSNTNYFWRVKPKNDCAEGSFSNTSNFTTAVYCPSTYTESNNSEYISNVTFNTLNNNSGNDHLPNPDDGYEDFTSMTPTTVRRTQTYKLSVAFNVAGFQDQCYVFIDWNQDFKFDNTTERYNLGALYTTPSTPSAPEPLTMDITVPESASLGKTRMRVIIERFKSKNNIDNGACDSDHKSEWGETEDYTIIVEEDFVTSSNLFKDLKTYPIPTNKTINLNFRVKKETVTISLFDLHGNLIRAQKFLTTSSIFSKEFNLGNLSSGLYILQIENGGKKTARKIIIR